MHSTRLFSLISFYTVPVSSFSRWPLIKPTPTILWRDLWWRNHAVPISVREKMPAFAESVQVKRVNMLREELQKQSTICWFYHFKLKTRRMFVCS